MNDLKKEYDDAKSKFKSNKTESAKAYVFLCYFIRGGLSYR